MNRTYIAGLTLSAALLFCAPAHADDLRPICPDRPGKGTSPCTLDQGHFQVEVDAYDDTYQRSGGVTTDFTVALDPTLKYGLTDTLDIEASLAPYENQHVKDGVSDSRISGHGDLYLRTKWNFLGTDGGALTAVAEPFVKLATATHGLGDGALEGGFVLPLSYDLGGSWSLSSTPEMDLLLNASGSGRHAAAIDVIGIGRSFEGGIALGAEFWTSQDLDRAGTTSQYSFDLDAAWQPAADANLQLDAGINFGLNRNTPDSQVYMGISRRL